jgi:4-alpha-glucanotransferase
MDGARANLAERIEQERFYQYEFFRQWFSLKHYCNSKGIQIIGDIPIYIDINSADVWANPQIFKLDANKKPVAIAGVPPDYFSKTGQRWGNPVYDWETLKKSGYAWWVHRIGHNLKLFDSMRIDHFRGFVAYWEIPATEATAVKGAWVEAPGEEFFKVLLRRFSHLPIIAEDLGVITPDVREFIRRYELPGMKVLLFAFDESMTRNPYITHNIGANSIVYTGTHDNDTVRGWFENDAGAADKQRVAQYLGYSPKPESIHWDFIRLAMISAANTVIIPMQDVLGLGREARMNMPSTCEGNWSWRLNGNELTSELAAKLGGITETYGRT